MSFTGDALKNLSTKLGTLMFIYKEKKKQDRNYYSQKNKILILINNCFTSMFDNFAIVNMFQLFSSAGMDQVK